jgi:hypothetical protein
MLTRASDIGESGRLENSGGVHVLETLLLFKALTLLKGPPSFFPQPLGFPARLDFEYIHDDAEFVHRVHAGRSLVHLTLAA